MWLVIERKSFEVCAEAQIHHSVLIDLLEVTARGHASGREALHGLSSSGHLGALAVHQQTLLVALAAHVEAAAQL